MVSSSTNRIHHILKYMYLVTKYGQYQQFLAKVDLMARLVHSTCLPSAKLPVVVIWVTWLSHSALSTSGNITCKSAITIKSWKYIWNTVKNENSTTWQVTYFPSQHDSDALVMVSMLRCVRNCRFIIIIFLTLVAYDSDGWQKLDRLLVLLLLLPSVLKLLAGRQEEHLACKIWVMRCWCGYLSAGRCRLSVNGPADATALKPHYHLLPHCKDRS